MTDQEISINKNYYQVGRVIWALLVLLALTATVVINYLSIVAFGQMDNYMKTIIQDNARSFVENEKRFKQIEEIAVSHANEAHHHIEQRLDHIENYLQKIIKGETHE